MKEPGFKVRLAIAKALDRDLYIKMGHFGYAVPAYGSINPAMGFYFDEGIADVSQQRFDLAEAQKLLAEAGFPGGEGFPTLKLSGTPSNRRDSMVVKNILKKNLGINVEVESKEPAVLLDEFRAMEFDMQRLGSGGDFDPDDALVDWMHTDSKFNGRKRDVEKNPLGYFSDPEVDALIDEQSATADPEKRKVLVQKVNRITSDKVATAFLYHPIDAMFWRKEVNFPLESRIPGLVDLDRVTLNG